MLAWRGGEDNLLEWVDLKALADAVVVDANEKEEEERMGWREDDGFGFNLTSSTRISLLRVRVLSFPSRPLPQRKVRDE